ncbi:hypothetical protein CEXT_599521 [Caerostris extrusa]|uniref:Uncharacterized protein n=1 Tax=Caerostris extrusa TaxID=172846 RepID=A0AAV4PRF5_CAEEX|nr:hypothetical protein CEXT_599521 [Caerostris extrusa]
MSTPSSSFATPVVCSTRDVIRDPAVISEAAAFMTISPHSLRSSSIDKQQSKRCSILCPQSVFTLIALIMYRVDEAYGDYMGTEQYPLP